MKKGKMTKRINTEPKLLQWQIFITDVYVLYDFSFLHESRELVQETS